MRVVSSFHNKITKRGIGGAITDSEARRIPVTGEDATHFANCKDFEKVEVRQMARRRRWWLICVLICVFNKMFD
jgi:hypothetical protein